jgi:sterol desaturase/sphingolipid hydroxylase (fatty acid hydroxylase superfamily)
MAPIVTADDWRAYTSRGWWLVVSWGLAAAFTFGVPALVRPRWGAVVAAFPSDTAAFVVGSWAMNAGLTLVGNLVFAVIYAAQAPVFERWKTNAGVPWPWRSPHASIRGAFWASLPWSVARVVANNLLVLPALVPTYHHARWWGAFSLSSSDFPGAVELVLHLAAASVVEDAMFYWTHRTLHRPGLYPHIHKVHHEYHHPIALSSEHAHPVEFFLGNLVPVIAGPILLRSHVFTTWMWILVRIAVSIDEHCGYTFPWSPVRLLPFGATTDGHDFHHAHNKDAIFASQYVWWDALCGTDRGFHEWRGKAAAAREAGAGAGAGAEGKPAAPATVREDAPMRFKKEKTK